MENRAGWLAFALVLWFTVSFALTNSMAGLAYQGGSDPLTVATARFIVPTVVLAVTLWFSGARFALPRRDAIATIILGLISAGFSFAILNAIEMLGVSLAVLIFFLFPLFTSLIVAVMGWEKLTAITVVAALVAFGGLALTLGVNGESLAILGVVFGLVGAFGLAIVSAVSSRVIRSGDSRQVTFYIVSTAAVVFIIFSLIRGELQLPQSSDGWDRRRRHIGVLCLWHHRIFRSHIEDRPRQGDVVFLCRAAVHHVCRLCIPRRASLAAANRRRAHRRRRPCRDRNRRTARPLSICRSKDVYPTCAVDEISTKNSGFTKSALMQ